MNVPLSANTKPRNYTLLRPVLHLAIVCIPYFLIELLSFFIIKPQDATALLFGFLWAIFFGSVCLILPRKIGKLIFSLTFFPFMLWAAAQTGYYRVFGKLMWFSTVNLAGEGAGYLSDVLKTFPLIWWLGFPFLLASGIAVLHWFPRPSSLFCKRLWLLSLTAISVIGMIILPELIFLKDRNIWGSRSEYARSSSYRAKYETMYDTNSVYGICGLYQMSVKDFYHHYLYPLTPSYFSERQRQTQQLDEYFEQRGAAQKNEMTGIYAGKNVVMVLMESMDDWMITPEDTPTLYRLMNEGLNFTSFYTPGYGSARTLNSEFCMNTGIFLPTTGAYVFDYVTNDFNQSIASQATANGYTADVFHYNSPTFYSRGVFEPALGYRAYRSYEDHITDEQQLFDENFLFDNQALSDLFFREGPTFNTIITRSAHLSYKYNEVLSNYALKQYPNYRGLYGSEEEDCARVKAKLVDDLFARLLTELEARGELENTVIMGVTDHYTYGYKNMDELYQHSGVEDDILLEKTPFFLWSYNGPSLEITKTLNTADILPTVLNLLGIDSPYRYLGQDAFDESYPGYAIFPNGDWISDGVVYKNSKDMILLDGTAPDQEEIQEMNELATEFISISNLLLTSNYYEDVRSYSTNS